MTDLVGHYRAYGPQKNFKTNKLELIRLVADTCESYEQRGYQVTLRQLYYQLVKDNVFANHAKNYDLLGSVLSDGRRAGMISWTAVEDRVRDLRGLHTQKSPREALLSSRKSYRLDKWHNQPMRPEVWVEKDALLGVVGRVCNELQVDYFSCHGYNSDSEAWSAGQRFASYYAKGQRPIVFHCGDHDPSGVHMTVDNRDKLEMFCGAPVQVVRLALNMNQIEELRPPPNPVKPSDSRTPAYVEQFGIETCWELDALSPEYLDDLIRQAILRIRDPEKWNAAMLQEANDLDTLDSIIETVT